MQGELIIEALKNATRIFKLSKKELGLLTGFDSRIIERWYRGKVSINETAVWADALGYQLVLKRKEMKK
tara:strand:+ start:299 stop:505 length:207 start_codon:yes stop_codon:yes gene_type:complete